MADIAVLEAVAEKRGGSSPLEPTKFNGACSSIGRALACGANCYGFEPRHAQHFAPRRSWVTEQSAKLLNGGFDSHLALHFS